MSPKQGILHDYDLWANREESAHREDFTCVICGKLHPQFQWSDFSGEAMCRTCGCPYQLKWGTDEQQAEGNYPYVKLTEKSLDIVRKYWQETNRWTCLGCMISGPTPGVREFNSWVEKNHPGL